MAVQPDGRIVATGAVIDGRSNRYFGALRYLPDGSLDGSFGSGGPWRSTRQLRGPARGRAPARREDRRRGGDRLRDLALLRGDAAEPRRAPRRRRSAPAASCACRSTCRRRGPTTSRSTPRGGIVMAGVRLRGGDAQDSALACVIRLLADGRPDPAFSGDGVALVDHGYGNDSAEAVVLRGGKVIVAGDGAARLRPQPLRHRAAARRRAPRPLLRPSRRRLVSFGGRRIAGAYGLVAAPRGRFAVAGTAVVEGRAPQSRSPGSAATAACSAAPAPHPAPTAGSAKAVIVCGGIVVAGARVLGARHRPVGLGPRPLLGRRPAARRQPHRLRHGRGRGRGGRAHARPRDGRRLDLRQPRRRALR